jgi:hypothetical protein
MFSRIPCHPPTGCYPTPSQSRPYTRMFIITYCLFQCLFLSQPIYTKWYLLITFHIKFCMHFSSRSQWPSGLKPGSTADRLLELWVRILTRAWLSVACDCFVCVLSGTGFSEGPIPRPEESHRPWCVTVCGVETSRMRRLCSALGRWKNAFLYSPIRVTCPTHLSHFVFLINLLNEILQCRDLALTTNPI